MKASEIAAKLNAAADLIEREGWYSGSSGGAHCAITALTNVSRGNQAPEKAFRRFLGLWQFDSLAKWNDSQADAAVVIAALRAAAEAEAQR